jgi:hypothetical protein
MGSKQIKDIPQVKDRITDIQIMALGEIEDNPRNWRVHTDEQGEALTGIVEQLGWAGMPLVYRSKRMGGKLTFVDGHLRKQQFPDLKVRVAITDFNDEEADHLIAVYDPISTIAQVDADMLTDLAKSIQSENSLQILRSLVDLDFTTPNLPVPTYMQPGPSGGPYAPVLAPTIDPINVTDADIIKEGERLENRFMEQSQANEYVEVICPHCAHEFYLNKRDVK